MEPTANRQTITVTWAPEAIERALEHASAVTRLADSPDDQYRINGQTITWMDFAALVDAARAVLAHQTEIERLNAELRDARSWARHGYEIGQRSATWSDEGVAPKWLTEGHNPAALAADVKDAAPEQTDPWRMDEWNALPDICFINSCESTETDHRGPVFLRDNSMHKACPDHWEPIMAVLGAQTQAKQATAND